MPKMSRSAAILKLVMLIAFLARQTDGQWVSRPPVDPSPLCGSQFALATHACSSLPYFPSPPVSPPSPPPSPPSPSSSSPPGHSQHHHRSRHGHHHLGTPVELECCKWLSEMDSECVCDVLIRLPVFLSRPIHLYTVQVGDACSVTYQCGSRIIR